MKTKEEGKEEIIHSLAKTSGKDEEEEEEGERVITIPPREEVERERDREKEGERERGVRGADERWSNGALSNLSEIGRAIESLQKLLLGKAVYMDEEAFAHASHNANLTRQIMAQERRIKVLERELDAAIASAGIARAEKRSAEVAQRAAETRTQEVLQELENTTQVFKLHMEELRSKQEELRKKDEEIKVLQAITETLSQGSNKGRNLLAAKLAQGSLRKDATS